MNWKIVECELAAIAAIVIMVCTSMGRIEPDYMGKLICFFVILIIILPIIGFISQWYKTYYDYKKEKDEVVALSKMRESKSEEQNQLAKRMQQMKIEDLCSEIDNLKKARVVEYEERVEKEIKQFYLFMQSKQYSQSSDSLIKDVENAKKLYEEYKKLM